MFVCVCVCVCVCVSCDCYGMPPVMSYMNGAATCWHQMKGPGCMIILQIKCALSVLEACNMSIYIRL